MLLTMAAICLMGCDPSQVSVSENVYIDIEVEQVSAGFCQIQFAPSKLAYYLIGCEKVRDTDAPERIPYQFMNLALDSAYMEYIGWRHRLLMEGCPYIAEFPDHSLQYGETDKYFQFLDPNTDYWVFAFVVDAYSNKPVGDLFYTTIHTDSESQIAVKFNYRVNGRWDYAYPLDTAGSILADVPWVAASIDSMELVERGYRVPGQFFIDSFATIYANRYGTTHFGVYACENNGQNNTKRFEEGHTYYTAMASLDGKADAEKGPKYFSMFRFTWQGDSTQLFLTHDENNTGGAW